MRRGIERIFVVFKTHLDVGFTGLVDEVLDAYAQVMVPQALEACRQSLAVDSGHPFVWTLPAWLLSECLRRLAGTPAGEELARRAGEGRVCWHALPFTTHTELFGLEDLIRGLYVGRGLRERFGRAAVSAKMTDVPGHTWILPTILASAGVSFLHLGCNSCSTPPDVPALFRWEGPDGSRVTTMYSRGGYGTPLLPPPDWNLPIWLALQHTSDNAGPQRAETVPAILRSVRERYPDADVTFGSLDDFARALDALRPDLPVVRRDLADTWIHGIGSMPREVSRLRSLRNQLNAFESAMGLKQLAGQSASGGVQELIRAAYEDILVFGEHTWGMDTKLALNPQELGGRAYEKGQFRAVLASGRYSRIIRSWDDKRGRISAAESRLGSAESSGAPPGEPVALLDRREVVNHHLWAWSGMLKLGAVPAGASATCEWNGAAASLISIEGETWADVREIPPLAITALRLDRAKDRPARRSARGLARREPRAREAGRSLIVENDLVRVRADRSGGITSLVDRRTGREWVDRGSAIPFGGYRYDVYSRREINDYLKSYAYDLQAWFVDDFGKPGYPPEMDHQTFWGRLVHAQTENGDGWARLFLHWKPDARSVAELGNASEVIQSVTVYRGHPWVDLGWTLSGKEECPLLESGHVVFPFLSGHPRYAINKTGTVVDPARDIAKDANHGLHCCDRWVDVSDADGGMLIIPFDTPLFSIGALAIEKFDGASPPLDAAVSFNLFNTQWGTNFPQWIGGDLGFRFRLIPHAGGWRQARVWEHAAAALQPPHVRRTAETPAPAASFLRASAENLETVTVKAAEAGDGIVLRLREPAGRAGKRVLRFRVPEGGRPPRIVRCSLLEDEQEVLSLSVTKGQAELALQVRSFEVVTLKLKTP